MANIWETAISILVGKSDFNYFILIVFKVAIGGFHVVAKIIRELKSHMIPYKFKCSHWWKLQHSYWRVIFHQ